MKHQRGPSGLPARQAEKPRRETSDQQRMANTGKSRFLAATSHNLRQPLQTLNLLLGALRCQMQDDKALALLERAQATHDVMVSMLDINQLKAGVISPKLSRFAVNTILAAQQAEFAEQMASKGLKWRVVPCSLTIYSDRILLADMLRNLISNALRYTDTGSVLLGCRRRQDKIIIELWDTGIGIAEDKLPAIFDDCFCATDRPVEGSFGLGLSIAHQIGDLLGAPLNVRSWLGKGSVFSIEVPRTRAAKNRLVRRPELTAPAAAASRFAGLTRREREVTKLVVEGHANKTIAVKLGISQRTVETHRAAAMKKLGAESLSELVRLEMVAQGC